EEKNNDNNTNNTAKSNKGQNIGALRKKISLERLILFDANQKLKRYKSIQEIIEDHFIECLKYYKRLKQMLIKNLEEEVYTISEKVRFIQLCCDKQINMQPPINNKLLHTTLTTL